MDPFFPTLASVDHQVLSEVLGIICALFLEKDFSVGCLTILLHEQEEEISVELLAVESTILVILHRFGGIKLLSFFFCSAHTVVLVQIVR